MAGEKFEPPVVVDKNTITTSASSDSEIAASNNSPEQIQLKKTTRVSSILTVIVAGLALFSDGYNAQIIGYMEPLFSDLYKEGISAEIKTRLSNSYLIGEIFGMLFFGYIIDKVGRRTGIIFATAFLVLGIVLATAAHGKSQLGMFWVSLLSWTASRSDWD